MGWAQRRIRSALCLNQSSSASLIATAASAGSIPERRSDIGGMSRPEGAEATKETEPLVSRTKISFVGMLPHIAHEIYGYSGSGRSVSKVTKLSSAMSSFNRAAVDRWHLSSPKESSFCGIIDGSKMSLTNPEMCEFRT